MFFLLCIYVVATLSNCNIGKEIKLVKVSWQLLVNLGAFSGLCLCHPIKANVGKLNYTCIRVILSMLTQSEFM